MKDVEAFVLGRLTMDLYPLQARTPLEDVETFQRSVGGFGGNVGTGLARLGVRTAVVSGVGDDGLGRFLVRALGSEGIDTSSIVVHPTLRTALAFCELWPPDRFPLTLYRRPTCPDQQLRPSDLPLDRIRTAPLVYVSGTALANEPSRSAAHAALDARRESLPGQVATILDLDWRPESWDRPDEYPAQMAAALEGVDTVIGGEAEFRAAGQSPTDVLGGRIGRVFLKRGPEGAAVLWPGGRVDLARHPGRGRQWPRRWRRVRGDRRLRAPRRAATRPGPATGQCRRRHRHDAAPVCSCDADPPRAGRASSTREGSRRDGDDRDGHGDGRRRGASGSRSSTSTSPAPPPASSGAGRSCTAAARRSWHAPSRS